MKKRIAAALLLCMVLALFAGCHGAEEKVAFVTPEVFDLSKNYEITFWAKNDTNLTQVNIYKKAIADFEAMYPNIKVNLRLYTDYGMIYNDVITNIPTNTTPNVCITYPDHIATYMTGENTVVPLDDLFANEKYGLGGSELRFDGVTREQIIPKFLGECAISGYHYALPYMRSTEACYINKDLVEKLGFALPEKLTWDFIWEVSEKAMEKDENGNFKANGQPVLIPFIYKSTDNMMIQYLKQKGAAYSTASGEVQIFNDSTREFLDTIGKHAASRAFSTFKISSYPGDYLNAGQCIFAIDSTAGATWMGSNAPLQDISADKLVPFETAVMEIPQCDPAHPQMISQGPSVCIFNKEDPQEVLASWLFTQYLLTDAVQIAYSQTEGYVPVTSKAQKNPAYQDYLSRAGEDNDFYYDVKIAASKLLLENTENTFVTPVFNGSASLRNAAGQLIESTVLSARRGDALDEAFMEKLYSGVASLYRLDQIQTSGDHRTQYDTLPPASVALLACVTAVWIIMGLYLGLSWAKRKKSGKQGK